MYDQNFSFWVEEIVIHRFLCLKNMAVPPLIWYAMKKSTLVTLPGSVKKTLCPNFGSKELVSYLYE